MTDSTKHKQREKFWKKLEDSHWDMGLLAEILIKYREKHPIK